MKTLFSNVHAGTVREHEYCYGASKKLLRNSQYSKSDNFKKVSVQGEILSFLFQEELLNMVSCRRHVS